MKITDELTFDEVLKTSWSGAIATAERIDEEGKGAEFGALIDELYPDGIDRTALNDLLWFDADWLFETLEISEEEDEDESEGEDDDE